MLSLSTDVISSDEFEDISFLGQAYSVNSADSAIQFSQCKYKCLYLIKKKLGDYKFWE